MLRILLIVIISESNVFSNLFEKKKHYLKNNLSTKMQLISLILLLILSICNAANTRNTRNNEFDWKLARMILNNECTGQNVCNVVLSPFTTKLSLTLLKKAIRDNSQSKRELSSVLPELFGYWPKTLGSLKEKNEENYVLMGSLIGLAKGSSVQPYLKKLAQQNFNTDVQTYDFSQVENTVKMLNDYVSTKTQGHVKDIVTSDLISNAQAIILNTIYFKANWQIEFGSEIRKEFKIDSTKRIQTTFMKTTNTFHYGVSQKLDSELIRMNYLGDKYAMYIILPKKVNGLQNVINNLDVSTIQNEISKMNGIKMILTLPKFKFESSFSLAKHLQKLGINKIFTEYASIEAIRAKSKLKVKDVLQKMGIEVSKSGTEAYGAIAIGLDDRFGDDDSVEPIEVTVDHPFAFFIEDTTTGAVLFTGKVMKP